MVAPFPFSSSFTFTDEIKTYLKSRNLLLDEYNIEINTKTLFKRYKNTFSGKNEQESKLIGVDFFVILNEP